MFCSQLGDRLRRKRKNKKKHKIAENGRGMVPIATYFMTQYDDKPSEYLTDYRQTSFTNHHCLPNMEYLQDCRFDSGQNDGDPYLKTYICQPLDEFVNCQCMWHYDCQCINHTHGSKYENFQSRSDYPTDNRAIDYAIHNWNTDNATETYQNHLIDNGVTDYSTNNQNTNTATATYQNETRYESPSDYHSNQTSNNREELDRGVYHTKSSDELGKYIDEMQKMYIQQHAFTKKQNEQWFEKLMVHNTFHEQNLQSQFRSTSAMQQSAPSGKNQQPEWAPCPMHYRQYYEDQGLSFCQEGPNSKCLQSTKPSVPPYYLAPLFDNVINGTRITLNNTPPIDMPVVATHKFQLPSKHDESLQKETKSKGRLEESQPDAVSVPHVNLYITVSPSLSQSRRPSAELPTPIPPPPIPPPRRAKPDQEPGRPLPASRSKNKVD